MEGGARQYLSLSLRSSGGHLQFQISPATTEKEEKEDSLAFELCGEADILNSGREGLMETFTFTVTRISTSCFWVATELISVVSN